MLSSHPIRLFSIALSFYILCHFAIQFLLPGTLGVDFVEQALFSQNLQFAYGIKQPPLYTWLQQAMNMLTGGASYGYVSLKYILLSLWFISFFAALRVWSADWNWSLWGTACLLLLYQVGWKAHFGITHTFLLCIAVSQTLLWIGVIRKTQRPSPIFYIALGISAALGIYAKHSYWLFLFPAIICVLVDRHISEKPKLILVTSSVTLLLVSPWILEILTQIGNLPVSSGVSVNLSQDIDSLDRLKNLSKLITSTLGFLSPLWVFLALALCSSLYQVRRPISDLWTSRFDTNISDRTFLHRLGLFIYIGTTFAILILGLSGFKERWMHPLLIAALIWSVLYCQSFFDDPASTHHAVRFRKYIWYIILGLSFLILLIRILQTIYGPPFCKRCRLIEPMPKLAQILSDRHIEPTHIFALDDHSAGNLRVFMRPATVYTPHYPYYSPPLGTHKRKNCLAIWRTKPDMPQPIPSDFADYISQYGWSLSATTEVENVSIKWDIQTERYSHWHYIYQENCPLTGLYPESNLHPVLLAPK